jgi:2-polyprenyl-3-methyl-5-hydroxy-6-metoxy-1,4-benzoquinol methylase
MVDSVRSLLLKTLRGGDEILDIGANDRNVEVLLRAHSSKAEYRSFDADHSMPHDYYDLATVDKKFSLILIFDVIEHLTPTDAAALLGRVWDLLIPAGRVLISTPNVDHPVRFWRDCTHITPFRYDELSGFLMETGFTEIEVFRIKKMKVKDWLRYAIAQPVLRLLDIDFAPGIAVRAYRASEQDTVSTIPTKNTVA